MSNLISDAKSVQSGQYEKFFGAKISAIGAKGAIGAKKISTIGAKGAKGAIGAK